MGADYTKRSGPKKRHARFGGWLHANRRRPKKKKNGGGPSWFSRPPCRNPRARSSQCRVGSPDAARCKRQKAPDETSARGREICRAPVGPGPGGKMDGFRGEMLETSAICVKKNIIKLTHKRDKPRHRRRSVTGSSGRDCSSLAHFSPNRDMRSIRCPVWARFLEGRAHSSHIWPFFFYQNSTRTPQSKSLWGVFSTAASRQLP